MSGYYDDYSILFSHRVPSHQTKGGCMLSSHKPVQQPIVQTFMCLQTGSLIVQRQGEPTPLNRGGIVPLGVLTS